MSDTPRPLTYRDIAGDGGSDVVAQVRERARRIAEALSGVRRKVAIASGKGGVGKSTLTRALAAALAERGWRVAILDADLNGPSQARLGGLAAATPVPGPRGLAMPRSADGVGVVSLGAFVPESEALEFDSVSQGDSFTWRATREFTTLAEILAGVDWGELDALLFDLPPGAERTVQFAEFLGTDTGVVLVTVPSAVSRGVVARSAAALARTPNPVLGHVLNMDGYLCGGCDEVRPLFPAGPGEGDDGLAAAGPRLGSVPFDPALAVACDRGDSPLDSAHPAAADAVRSLARRLVERLSDDPPHPDEPEAP